MTGIDYLLSAVLYRDSCPDPEVLGEYYLRRLAPGDRLVVAKHLRLCSQCAAELRMYAPSQANEAGSVLDGLFGAERNALAGLVSKVAWAIPSGSPTPVRTSDDAFHTSQGYALGLVSGGGWASSDDKSLAMVPTTLQIYQSEDVLITLSLWSATRGRRSGAVLGTVRPPSTALGAELWNIAGFQQSGTVSRDGQVVFDHLEAGSYFMCLRQDTTEIWLEMHIDDSLRRSARRKQKARG